jgi:acyl-coenzyme A synthetase/AMP-(fatty) acid ligase
VSSSRRRSRRRRRRCQDAFKAPKHVVFVDELPKNASGKILKRNLRERFAGVAGDTA